MLAGAAVLIPWLPIIYMTGMKEATFSLAFKDLILIEWLCIFAVGASIVTWLISTVKLGVTVTTIHLNIVSFYVLILMMFFGGTLLTTQIAGGMIVSFGVFIAQLPSK